MPDDACMWVRCDCLIGNLLRPCITHKLAHPVLAVLEKAEERALCKLVCQDIELCQVGQGGNREQVILVSLHILEMNCNACDGVMDLTEAQTRLEWAELYGVSSWFC